MSLPPNTAVAGERIYIDQQTLVPITKTEYARRMALQWRQEKGDWPSVDRLAIAAEVGHGTAQEGLRRAQGKPARSKSKTDLIHS